MFRACTFRACFKSLRVRYPQAYERARNFLRPGDYCPSLPF